LNRNVPVVSVNVRTKNWFKWWDGYTDINGNFQCPKDYIGNISYSLRWQYPDNRFDIRSGTTGQAYYNGPSQSTSAWNLVISSGISWTYAHIFRAGSYYCGTGRAQYGFNNPPFNLISIQAMDENGPTDMAGYFRPWNENIRIWKNWSNGTRISSRDLFIITTHELGHAHHDEVYDGSFGINVDSRVAEPWACAAGYYMTSSVYSLPLTNSLLDWYHRQLWKVGGDAYSPLMIDLIDSYDQRSGSSQYLLDRVTGYTLKQMETIIAKGGCKTINDFINEVKALSLPSGMRASIVSEYLNQYIGDVIFTGITLQTNSGKYLCAEQGGGADVNATRTSPGTWETFSIIDGNGGSLNNGDIINIRTSDNSHYFRALNSGGSGLDSRATISSGWESFEIQKASSGDATIRNGDKVFIRTSLTGHYLCAEGGGGGDVNANRSAPGAWETFTIRGSF